MEGFPYASFPECPMLGQVTLEPPKPPPPMPQEQQPPPRMARQPQVVTANSPMAPPAYTAPPQQIPQGPAVMMTPPLGVALHHQPQAPPPPPPGPQPESVSWIARIMSRRREFMKLVTLALMVLLALALHELVVFLLRHTEQATEAVQVAVRLLYVMVVLVLLWLFKAFN